jgi:isoleucyl-tRNA synthetase
LPSNLALAVNTTFDYVKVKDLKRDITLILAECRLKDFFKKEKDPKKAYTVLEKFKGEKLVGKAYKPMFDYFLERKDDGCFKVFAGTFVTSDAGTGIVHCAPGFGEEDYKMCVKAKIIKPDNPVCPIDEAGRFTDAVPNYKGIFVKDADKDIKKELKARGRLVEDRVTVHSYPFCWRSDSPLIYRSHASWFINVTDIKP